MTHDKLREHIADRAGVQIVGSMVARPGGTCKFTPVVGRWIDTQSDPALAEKVELMSGEFLEFEYIDADGRERGHVLVQIEKNLDQGQLGRQ